MGCIKELLEHQIYTWGPIRSIKLSTHCILRYEQKSGENEIHVKLYQKQLSKCKNKDYIAFFETIDKTWNTILTFLYIF